MITPYLIHRFFFYYDTLGSTINMLLYQWILWYILSLASSFVEGSVLCKVKKGWALSYHLGSRIYITFSKISNHWIICFFSLYLRVFLQKFKRKNKLYFLSNPASLIYPAPLIPTYFIACKNRIVTTV